MRAPVEETCPRFSRVTVNQVRLHEETPERLRKTSLYSVVSPRDRRATRGNLRVVAGRALSGLVCLSKACLLSLRISQPQEGVSPQTARPLRCQSIILYYAENKTLRTIRSGWRNGARSQNRRDLSGQFRHHRRSWYFRKMLLLYR